MRAVKNHVISEGEEKKGKRYRSRRAEKCGFLMMIVILLYLFGREVWYTIHYKEPEEQEQQVSSESILDMVDSYIESNQENTQENTQVSTEEPASEEDAYSDTEGNFWADPDIFYKVYGYVDDSYFEQVCFLGDSRTKGLLEYSDLPEWQGFYKIGYTAENACSNKVFTISNDTGTYNMLQVIEKVDYDIYYLGFGTNELFYNDSSQFISEYKVLIDKIRECHPNAVIYIENILPMSEKYSNSNASFSNDRAAEYNLALLAMCKDYGDLVYLDIASCMMDENGAAKQGATGDGIHYNPDEYQIIMDYIKRNVVVRKNEL